MVSKLSMNSSGSKRIGDLLLEAGFISQQDQARGLDYSRKTSLPLGRVLVMLRAVTERDLKHAVHAQSLIKFDSLPADTAIKALALTKQTALSFDEALAQLGWKQQAYTGSRTLTQVQQLEQSIHDLERRLGPHHPSVAEACVKLGDYFVDNEVFGQAEAAYSRAINVSSKTGAQLQLATALARLGNLMFLTDRYDEALPLYQQSYQLRENVLGAGSTDLADSLHDLAEIYDVQGKYADAERYYLQCLELREKLFEIDESQVLEVIKRLVHLARRMKRSADQISLGQMLTGAGLVDHASLNNALLYAQANNQPLGRAIIELNKVDEADLQSCLQAQMLIRNNVLPAEIAKRGIRLAKKHKLPLTDALKLLGWRAHEQARTFELGELLKTSDELMQAEQMVPADDPVLGTICVRLAELYYAYDKYGESEQYYKRAIAILEKSMGPESLEIALLLDRLGDVYLWQERFRDTETIFRRSLQIRSQTLGSDHIEVATSYMNLGRLYQRGAKYAEAIAWYERALKAKEKTVGSKNEQIADVIEALGQCYFEQQDYATAEPLFWRAYKIRKNTMDPSHPKIISVLTWLADLYSKEGKFTLADSVLELLH